MLAASAAALSPGQPASIWPTARPDAAIPPRATVCCWRIETSTITPDLEIVLNNLLSAEEQGRAERFRRIADRHNFIAAHSGLRLLVAAALDRRPHAIRMAQTSAGKPWLIDLAMEFNLSHANNIVLIALASGIPVGIDVETPRALLDREAITKRFLHPGEAADLAQVSGDEAELAFFRCWTRKEAVAKALGLGLSLPLDSYRVSCLRGEPARLLALDAAKPSADSWSLVDLVPGPNHVGALAAPVQPITVICRTLDLAAAAPR